MLQFFLSGGGLFAGSTSIDFATNDAVLIVAQSLEGAASLTFTTTASLQNVPALSGIATLTFDLPAAELITPLEDTGEDELRRRVIKADVWEFPRRKIELLH